MSKKILGLFLSVVLIVLILKPAAASGAHDFPKVLSIKERVELVNTITLKRLDLLVPKFMRETGLDMWIIACNEDNLDPIFETMIPYGQWCPITQIIVFYDRGSEKGVERLNVSRTNMPDFFKRVWDAAAWDNEKKVSQWACLGRIVRERDPKRIGINEGEIQWAAGGMTVVLKNRLVKAIGPDYAGRLESAEPLATLWGETLLNEEIMLMERAAALSHAIIAETFSTKVVTPGKTTVEDLRYHYWQRVADFGLDLAFYPFFSIRGRQPDVIEKYGKDDTIIRPGDFIHCDVGLKYLYYNSDHQEWAYVPRVGETDVPGTFKKIMAECNRLQDVFCGEFKTGLTGNQLLANILETAHEKEISKPRIYSHSLGYFLHEPGPLIGLPWEQVNNPGRGDVKLVPNSCFTAEMSVTMPVPQWDGKEFRLSLEQDIVFTGEATHFLDGRQTEFHIIK
ncbi:MAG: M24 family metallopeptidase [Candidatus Aminicenantes bacterium]